MEPGFRGEVDWWLGFGWLGCFWLLLEGGSCGLFVAEGELEVAE